MNKSTTLLAMMKEHGFIDHDVIEFGAILIEECINLIDNSDGSISARELLETHFGIEKPHWKNNETA
jgi:hypothetical protein